ncbi:MAG: hypothetical protein QXQ18_00835 [Candidatus Aenigmatarchaeota archaeon]
MEGLANSMSENKSQDLQKVKEIFRLEKEKQKPLLKGKIPIGEGKNVNWTLWKNNVSLERREKQEDGRWHTTETFHLSKSVLKEIAWRASHWLSEIDKNNFNFKKGT